MYRDTRPEFGQAGEIRSVRECPDRPGHGREHSGQTGECILPRAVKIDPSDPRARRIAYRQFDSSETRKVSQSTRTVFE